MSFLWITSLIVLCGSLGSIAGLLWVRKFITFEKLRPSHDVGGYLLSVVGTLYAVLLGLVVVDAMQQYQHAKCVTEMEANTLSDIFVMANRLHEPERSKIQLACRNYIGQVISSEWLHMKCGGYCPIARGRAVELMKMLVAVNPENEIEKALYPALVQESSVFWQNRQARLLSAQNHLPAFEWVILILGGFIVIIFTFFFGLEHFELQLLMTGMLGTLLSLNFALLLFFAYPFNSELGIQANAFKAVEDIFSN
jgi:H+/Cl- antiporter ClcA